MRSLLSVSSVNSHVHGLPAFLVLESYTLTSAPLGVSTTLPALHLLPAVIILIGGSMPLINTLKPFSTYMFLTGCIAGKDNENASYRLAAMLKNN